MLMYLLIQTYLKKGQKAQVGTLLLSFPRLIYGVNVPLLILQTPPILCCLG